ncbi:MAG: hypothetical protein Q9162_001142 [Coniocarpon cinnabarinum]
MSEKLTTPQRQIVPDDVLRIQGAITRWADDRHGADAINLIVCSGGTGFARRDVTPETVSPLIHRHAPGLVHLMLSSSLNVTPFAAMSRPVAGVRHSTLILTLPGSPKGAKENLEAVISLLPHACQQAAGQDSRQAHIGGTDKLEKDAGLDANSHVHDHSHGHGHHHGPKSHTSNDPSRGPAQRARQSPFEIKSTSEALRLVADHTPPPFLGYRSVGQSLLAHVLASDVKAEESVPAFRASIVDGYAVKCNSTKANNHKGTFPVAFAAHAEAGKERELKNGEIARITTGAPLPNGADAVVMVEDTKVASTKIVPMLSGSEEVQEEDEVEILTDAVQKGENIREPGSDVKQGDVILRSGEIISALGGEFGLLASCGVRRVNFIEKPIVGVLSTGDEIMPYDHAGPLKPGEVRDTNRPTLLSAIAAQGFEAVDLGIAKDKPHELESTLRSALFRCDVLITSGGVSMGELDLLKPTIECSLGGTIHFGRVGVKPGKPTTFATIPSSSIKDPHSGERFFAVYKDKMMFSLPGNPASAVVTFLIFVLPALHIMSGMKHPGLPAVSVQAAEEFQCDRQREEYVRVSYDSDLVESFHLISRLGLSGVRALQLAETPRLLLASSALK